jgi:D-galactarolactone cycloisomerase
MSLTNIVEVRGYQVNCAMLEPIGNSVSWFDQRPSFLVEVITKDGTSGWGESGPWLGAISSLVQTLFAPAILGSDCDQPVRLWRDMKSRIRTEHRGVAMLALSAVDIAIWDAAARCREISIATMLGGALRSHIEAYASGPYFSKDSDPYARYLFEVEKYLKAGFKAFKFRGGLTPRRDGQIASDLRKLVGPDIKIMTDINQGYVLSSALEAARRMEEASLFWIEEPIAPDDLDGYQSLCATQTTPISGGEPFAGLAPFRDILERKAMAIIQPDVSICGGFSAALQIAGLAEAFHTPFVPHVWGTCVNLCASLQMAAVVPEQRSLPLFEYDQSYNPLRDLAGAAKLDGSGRIAIPSGPGIGIEITAETFAPYITETWSIRV